MNHLAFGLLGLAVLSACSQSPRACDEGESLSGGQCVAELPSVEDPNQGQDAEPPPAGDPPPVIVPDDPSDPNADLDIFSEISAPMSKAVDDQYPKYRELTPTRAARSDFAKIDSCDPSLEGHTSFGDRITAAVHLRFTPRAPQISYVSSYFSIPSDQSKYAATGLISHPLCPVTRAALETVFQGKRVPTDAVIAKADRFSKLINQHRASALAGSREGQVQSRRLWTKFMMCLSYMESLTTADVSSADTIAANYGFRRPAGVSLYDDPYQTNPASKLAIGIFQMSPDSGGNVQACIRQWNLLYPACRVEPNAGWRKMIDVLGSSQQTFNTFCGVSKVTDMFGVQVNATAAKNTHPANVRSNGTLKPPAERCVSPFMNVATSYNHFGPFQNVHGFTLDQILTCTLKGE